MASRFNDAPPRGLLSWNIHEYGEPRKGAYTVHVRVWIPKEVVRKDIGAIADYLESRLGWKVHRNGGWCGGGLMLGDDEWTIVGVNVRAREIRAALKADARQIPPPPPGPPHRSRTKVP